MKQWTYKFGKNANQGKLKNSQELLGGKGANLCEMSGLGIPVPPGFTLTTEICKHFYDHDKSYPAELRSEVDASLKWLEGETGMKFGDKSSPLLVSVRSGAAASMPGMMDTILNLGLNDETVEGLAKNTKDARFAYDSYRRFIQMYGNVVLNVDHHLFEEVLSYHKEDCGYIHDTDLSADDWQEMIEKYKEIIQDRTGHEFPQDVRKQLWRAVDAVFNSWMNQRAITYRRIHNISEKGGTAVNIQSMVFGNMGDDCATGVAFTRDPSTGENYFYGEYLINAQGEDVVAGIRTPQSLTIQGKGHDGADLPSLEEAMPETFKELCDVRAKLEHYFQDMQDIEFTIQQGKLWMLQTRSGKRTAPAALKMAVDMAKSGLIDRKEAVARIDPHSLEQLLHPILDPKAIKYVLTKGLPASPGAASGSVVFSADEAEERANEGDDVILVRTETSPEDIHGMHAAKGILTTRGGMTSHAAVVARGMGRVCVVGAGSIQIDYKAQYFTAQGKTVNAGDRITIVGATGEILLGEVPTIQPELSSDFETLMNWADEMRSMKVRANAETPNDAATARRFGAEGIGLCRTEHMFFDEERILAIREMIFAESEQDRCAALDKLLPHQTRDFAQLFEIMDGLPITIRLLDPPLHEFLPHAQKEIAELAKSLGKTVAEIERRAEDLHETNPMLGHRGCRLGISYPEIYQMQARAIFNAAVSVHPKITPQIEVMIPLVASKEEMKNMADLVRNVANSVLREANVDIEYLVGTMIELPRAALCAESIAANADFFSFGTNDLTQTTFGLSRDDASKFLNAYRLAGVMSHDPFMTLDREGVGELMQIAIERGRKNRPNIKLGICGEHGGDPDSIKICQELGLDYVSCSPYRVPIARLAAAQSALFASFKKKAKCVSS
jgi:pyruvate, orthophosphate dikinase